MHTGYTLLPALHTDLFIRHASPLEVYIIVVVDERGEGVLSEEIYRRCNGKQQRIRRGGRNVLLTRWVMNKTKGQHIIALAWCTKMKPLSWGESLSVVEK